MPELSHIRHTFLAKIVPAMVLLVLALGLKQPFIDKYYQNTFTRDAEICVELTRSFYFFVKDPSAANAPQQLQSYPTYFEGPFLLSAIHANVTRELIQHGWLNEKLSDADNSLIIYSMRHTSWLLAAFTVLLVYLILLRLTNGIAISLLFSGGYYLFNLQQMQIDLMRVDHYILFAFALLTYACVRILQKPEKLTSYLLLGVAGAIILPTKMNAPIYLFGAFLALLLLLVNKQLRWKYIPAGLLAFGAVLYAFLFRWFMYPERIVPTLTEIYDIGKLWVAYWSKDPWDYYINQQFFDYQSSLAVSLFMVLVAVSFVVILLHALNTRKKMPLYIVGLFVAHVLFGIISPKINRYGIYFPIYYTVLPAYALYLLQIWLNKTTYKRFSLALVSLLMLPVLVFHVGKYQQQVQVWADSNDALETVRLEPTAWLKQHVQPGSHIMIYHPRINNPPMFDLPARFLEDKLDFKFLEPDKLMQQLPPNKAELLHYANYIVINSNYYSYHFENLNRFTEPSADLFLNFDNYTCYQEYTAGIPLPGTSDNLMEMQKAFIPILAYMWEEEVSFNEACYPILANKFGISKAEAFHLAMYFKQCVLHIDKDSTLYFSQLAETLAPAHTALVWHAFYEALETYQVGDYDASPQKNYLSSWMRIYQLPNTALSTPWPSVEVKSQPFDSTLYFTVNDMWQVNEFSFQLQISETPNMQWLVSPNIDGFTNKYNQSSYPTFYSGNALDWMPASYQEQIATGSITLGEFHIDTEKDYLLLAGLGQYFRQSASMLFKDSTLTFGEALQQVNLNMYNKAATWLDDAVGGNGALLDAHFNEFLTLVGKDSITGTAADNFNYNLQAEYKPNYLCPNKTYYWRVRLKYREQPITQWSEITAFTTKAQ